MTKATIVGWNNGRGGKKGEEAVLNLLRTCDDIQEIRCVSHNKEYQKKDIDFVVKQDDGQKIYIEAKYDGYNRYTGNLMVETMSNVEYNNLGWLYTTESDTVTYFQKSTGYLYMADTNNLKQFMQQHGHKYREFPQETPLKYKNASYHSKAKAVSIQDMLDHNVIFSIVDTDDNYNIIFQTA